MGISFWSTPAAVLSRRIAIMEAMATIQDEIVSQINKDYATVKGFLEARSTIFQELMKVQESVR
jgi:hypothetical protein